MLPELGLIKYINGLGLEVAGRLSRMERLQLEPVTSSKAGIWICISHQDPPSGLMVDQNSKTRLIPEWSGDADGIPETSS